jgi:fido (protein-threonine AMPylation protein)
MKGSRPPKYRTDPGLEGEFESGSRGKVLRNKLGIRTIKEMDQAEYNALEDAQERYLDVVTDKTVFTAQFIQDMHRDWLGGIYEWAGMRVHARLLPPVSVQRDKSFPGSAIKVEIPSPVHAAPDPSLELEFIGIETRG